MKYAITLLKVTIIYTEIFNESQDIDFFLSFVVNSRLRLNTRIRHWNLIKAMSAMNAHLDGNFCQR